MLSSYSIFTVSVNKPSGLLQFVFTKEATLNFHFFTNMFFFYLSLFLKGNLRIKVIEVIPLIVFSIVYPGVSPLLFIYSIILSFILFHFTIIINFNLLLCVCFFVCFFVVFFPPFPPLSSLFLTFQEVDMTALQFAGPSFPLSSSYHPSYYFYLLTPHPLILILTLF